MTDRQTDKNRVQLSDSYVFEIRGIEENNGNNCIGSVSFFLPLSNFHLMAESRRLNVCDRVYSVV